MSQKARTEELRMKLLELKIFQLPDSRIATGKPDRGAQLYSQLLGSHFHLIIQQAHWFTAILKEPTMAQKLEWSGPANLHPPGGRSLSRRDKRCQRAQPKLCVWLQRGLGTDWVARELGRQLWGTDTENEKGLSTKAPVKPRPTGRAEDGGEWWPRDRTESEAAAA